MSGNLQGNQGVEHDDHSVPENLDDFLNYLNETWGRTRAKTEPDLSKVADDSKSVVSSPEQQIDDDESLFDPKMLRKTKEYDVNALAAALKGNSAPAVDGVPSYQLDPDIRNIKASQLTENDLKEMQEQSKKVSELSAELFKTCKDLRKTLDPYRKELDDILDARSQLKDPSGNDADQLKALVNRKQKVTSGVAVIKMKVEDLRDQRDVLDTEFDEILLVIQGDKSIVGTAPNDFGEAKRAFLELDACATFLFDDSQTIIDPAMQAKKVKDIVSKTAQEIIKEANALQKTAELQKQKVEFLSSQLSGHANNDEIPIGNRINDLATCCASLLDIKDNLDDYFSEGSTIKERSRPLKKWADKFDIADKALDAIDDMVDAINALDILVEPSLNNCTKEISRLQKLQIEQSKAKQQKKDKDDSKSTKNLSPEEAAAAEAGDIKEFADALKKIFDNLTLNVNALNSQLSEVIDNETLELRQQRITKAFSSLMNIHMDVDEKFYQQALQIKDRNAELRPWRENLAAADSALDSVDAMVDGYKGLEQLLKAATTAFTLEIQRLRKMANQKNAMLKAATLKDSNVDALEDSSKVLLYDGLTGIDDAEQQQLLDNEQFRKISQLADGLADACEDDVIFLENLDADSVEDANKATKLIRGRLTSLYLPQLKKMNEFLKKFPREQALYNNALQRAGIDTSNLQDVCDELRVALSSLYEGLGTKISEADPSVPLPPNLTEEEDKAKSFRRDAEALESEGRKLQKILADATGDILAAGSPKEFDRLVQEHIKATTPYDAPLQRTYVKMQKRRAEIANMNGGLGFEQHRSAGLQALRRFEQLDLKQCFNDYIDVRQQANDVLRQAIKDCQPLIEEAKKLKEEIPRLTEQAFEGLRVTSWLPYGAKNQFNDLRERVEELVSEADELQKKSTDGMHITSECRHQVDEAVKTLQEGDLFLSKLLAEKIKPAALEKMYDQLGDDCTRLIQALDTNADSDLQEHPDDFWKKIQEKSKSLNALVINLDIDSKSIRLARGLMRDVELIMSGAQPPDKDNQQQMEDSVADEIAELIDEADELQDNFGEIMDDAIALQEDSQVILFSDFYETLQERRGAWDRRDKTVLNSPLQMDSNRRLKTVYRRLDELEQLLDWEPKIVKQLRAAYNLAYNASQEAEAQVAEAVKLAGRLPEQLELRWEVMAPSLDLKPKRRIEIKLRDDDDAEIEIESNNLDDISKVSFGTDNDSEPDNASDVSNDADDEDSLIDDGPSLQDAINVINKALDTMIAAAKEGVEVLSGLKAENPAARGILNKYIMIVTQQFLRDLMDYERFVEVQSQLNDDDDLKAAETRCTTASTEVRELQKAIQAAHLRLQEQPQVQKDDDSDDGDNSSVASEPQKIPQEVHDEIDERYLHWFSRLNPPPDNAAEIKKELLEAVVAKRNGDLSGDSNWRGAVDDEAYRLYSAERDRRQKAEEAQVQAQTRFQLTAQFWKDNKQSGVDFVGRLTRTLQKYEDLLKKANSASGVDKLNLLVKVKEQLADVDTTAAKVLKGLKDKHSASRDLLQEVPAVVRAAQDDANAALDKVGSYFRGLTYKKVRSDKQLKKLWKQYYSDPQQGTVKQQEDFIKEYEKGRLKQSTYDRFLKKESPDFLNLSVPKLDQFEINDKSGWEKVYVQVIKQQELHLTDGMFGGWMIEERKY